MHANSAPHHRSTAALNNAKHLTISIFFCLQQYTIVSELPGVDCKDLEIEITQEAGVNVTFTRATLEDQLWHLGLHSQNCLFN